MNITEEELGKCLQEKEIHEKNNKSVKEILKTKGNHSPFFKVTHNIENLQYIINSS